MTLVRKILEAKGFTVWSISPDATVYTALKLMAEKNVGALPVVDSKGLIGMMSERDYARKVVLFGKSSIDTRVRDIMSVEIHTVRPDQSIEDCMKLMTQWRVRHLPVIDDGRMIGLLSVGDVVKAIITDKDSMIEHLENYITGRHYPSDKGKIQS